jgi:hypothetical protein
MNRKFIIGILGIIMLISTVFLFADSSRTINYQGYLTDSLGEPLNGTIGVSFYIYESLLTQMWMWSESHAVECENGLFSVVLGQTTPFQDSVFNGEDRYLGIRIGDDSEISPRTLITAVPHAFISQQMSGDIETEDGKLVMKDIDGDSVIIMESNFDGTKSLAGSIKMFNPQPEPPAKMFEVNADVTSGASLNLYNDIGQVMGVEPSPFNDGYLLKLIDPGDDGKIVEIGAFPSSGGSIKMFNPQPEPPALLLDMTSDYSAKGGSAQLSMYDVAQNMESHLSPGSLTLKTDLVGAPGAEIHLNASGIVASIGIGTDSVPEALTVMGNGWFSGDVFIYTDTKAKRNIQTIDGALEKVSKMRGVYYDCRTDELPQLKMPENRQVGFLAQEVKEVVPEIVGENEYGLTGVDYSRITALLVEAVKELKTQNEELKATNEELIQRIEALENAR